jgi:PIN domain nuclease of toxin-antitoxin system
MKLLLDSCAFIWLTSSSGDLSAAAQAHTHAFTLVSPDAVFARYGVKVLW